MPYPYEGYIVSLRRNKIFCETVISIVSYSQLGDLERSIEKSNRVRKDKIMKKTAALLTLLVFVAGPAAVAVEDAGSFAEAKAMAAELNKPLLVDFFTEW